MIWLRRLGRRIQWPILALLVLGGVALGILARIMPQIRGNTQAMAGEMASVEENMELVRNAMGILDSRIHGMTGGVVMMREHMSQFARPMAGIVPFMP